jgi:hypothetical protein
MPLDCRTGATLPDVCILGVIMNAGLILFLVGIAFLVLALLSAAKDVLTQAPAKTGDHRESVDVAAYTELIKELGKLKMWLALAIFGFLLTMGGSLLMNGASPLDLLGITKAAAPAAAAPSR